MNGITTDNDVVTRMAYKIKVITGRKNLDYSDIARIIGNNNGMTVAQLLEHTVMPRKELEQKLEELCRMGVLKVNQAGARGVYQLR